MKNTARRPLLAVAVACCVAALAVIPAFALDLVEIDFLGSSGTTWTNNTGTKVTVKRIDIAGLAVTHTNTMDIIIQVPVAALGVATNSATRNIHLLNDGVFIGSTNINPTDLQLDVGTMLHFTNTQASTTNTVLMNIQPVAP